MLSARNNGFSSSYSLSDQEAQQLFRRHLSYVQLPIHLEAELTSRVLFAVRKQHPLKYPLSWLKDLLFASQK